MASKKDLWAAQLEEYPKSVAMTPREVLIWCHSAVSERTRLFRYMAISLALEYPRVVFYRINGKHKLFIGFRYGIQDNEYMPINTDE